METIQMQYLAESSPPARRANFMVIYAPSWPRGHDHQHESEISTRYVADRSAPSNHDDTKTGERSGFDHSLKGPTWISRSGRCGEGSGGTILDLASTDIPLNKEGDDGTVPRAVARGLYREASNRARGLLHPFFALFHIDVMGFKRGAQYHKASRLNSRIPGPAPELIDSGRHRWVMRILTPPILWGSPEGPMTIGKCALPNLLAIGDLPTRILLLKGSVVSPYIA